MLGFQSRIHPFCCMVYKESPNLRSLFFIHKHRTGKILPSCEKEFVKIKRNNKVRCYSWAEDVVLCCPINYIMSDPVWSYLYDVSIIPNNSPMITIKGKKKIVVSYELTPQPHKSFLSVLLGLVFLTFLPSLGSSPPFQASSRSSWEHHLSPYSFSLPVLLGRAIHLESPEPFWMLKIPFCTLSTPLSFPRLQIQAQWYHWPTWISSGTQTQDFPTCAHG